MTNYKNQSYDSNRGTKEYYSGRLDWLKEQWNRLDWPILLIVITLTLIGLISIFSATMALDPYAHLRQQGVAMIIGLIAILVLSITPYTWITNMRLIILINLGVVVLLMLTHFFGIEVNGSKAWLDLGIQFQPSEIFKFTMIPMIALAIEHVNREEILSLPDRPKYYLITFIAILASVFILLTRQPDYGMTIIIIGATILTFALLYANIKFTFVASGIVLVVLGIIYFISRNYGEQLIAMGSHPFTRIAIFTDPFQYDLGEGYQLVEAFRTISRGGWLGVGLGNGIAKSGRLPATETDFIIAHIGEELGFIGILFILILFFVLLLLLFQRAARTRDIFRRSVIIGVASIMLIQIITNIAGAVSLIPLTGVTLPFVSYGGTSLMVSYALIGLALRMINEEERAPKINLVYSRKAGE